MKANKPCTLISSLALLAAASCATGQATPRELVSARDAYNRASSGPGMELAPAQLHLAKQALERAEKSFEDDPESRQTRDYAYVAERKAQLAESQAGLLLAEQQKAHAERVAVDAVSQAHAATQAELARTKEQLAQAESASKDALSKLKGLQNAVREDERGVVITLSGAVLFDSGKSELLAAARGQLDEIAQALVGAHAQHVSVEGFTDSTGKLEFNNMLSEKRAQSVASYLTSKGLSSQAVKAAGRGPSNPIASNKTREGRATNRRVEIVIHGETSKN